ncbi:outer membrane protein assembly factor BamC [Wohlfahrtiimonas larvae]|uniref:Outer membrane protein assembly factor BamC n=1 Tax=Wohlfahrtiimonas larvae TaxID=1157986 RepID=A0ABP9MAY2_9GAMM|nr:outer membrane protein assembly factor BamC [Wohlfahrtiimonas larvae]
MKYNKALIGGLAGLIVLSGCSTNSIQPKGRLDYLQASSVNPLELPPDLVGRGGNVDSNNRTTQMLSDYQKQANNRNNMSNRVLVSSDAVRIERSGDTRWIATTLPAEYVWSRSVQLFQEVGLPIEIQNPEAGILESGWAENRADVPDSWIRQLLKSAMDNVFSSPTRDKFRIRLERGGKGEVLVYVTHYGMKDQTSGRDNEFHTWVDRPRDSELEAEMISRLAAKLGVANPKEVKSASSMIMEETANGVVINRPLDTVWIQVGNILDDGATFKIESQNSNEYSYMVLQRDPNKTKGGGLKFWQEKESIYYRFNVTMSADGKNRTTINIESLDRMPNSEIMQRLRTSLH